MIYCVVPKDLEAELYSKLVEHYKDDANVTVIVDRREGERRSNSLGGGLRRLRDRRRLRVPGTFPPIDPKSLSR